MQLQPHAREMTTRNIQHMCRKSPKMNILHGKDRSKKGGKASSECSFKSDRGTPMSEVEYRIYKLPLQGILDGQKLGVYGHHAAQIARKLPGTQCVQLKAHLQLVEHAKLLAPGAEGPARASTMHSLMR